MIKLKLADISFDTSIYPRKSGDVDSKRVARYVACLRDGDRFPPIKVEPWETKYRLLDGLHRKKAHEEIGELEIEAEVVALDGQNPLLFSALCQDRGKDLGDSDAESVAQRVFQADPKISNREIAGKLGRSESAVSGYLKDLRARYDMAQDVKIFKMHQLGIPQERIAQRLGVSRDAIQEHLCKTSELNKSTNDLLKAGFSSNTICEKLGWDHTTIYKDIENLKNGKSAENQVPDPLRFADVWNFSECDRKFGHDFKGRIPGQIVQHTLYYYTEVFDIVVDPMAGSGTTIDVSKLMLRRYRAYDLNPVRSDIQKHNILDGLPEETKGCNLIFADPPYWDMNEGDYQHPEGSLASLTLDAFLAWEAEFAKSCKTMLAKEGHVAFLIQSQTGPSVPADRGYIDHAFEAYQRFAGVGLTPIRRYSVPMPTETLTPQHIEKAKEERRMLILVRDLLIFRKR